MIGPISNLVGSDGIKDLLAEVHTERSVTVTLDGNQRLEGIQVLFALKKYPESAAAVYAVLSAGPGWDWTTMRGWYPSTDVYTQQLRELENFAKANPASADASFLLGYHDQTMGHKESAAKAFRQALDQLPGGQTADVTRWHGISAGHKSKNAAALTTGSCRSFDGKDSFRRKTDRHLDGCHGRCEV